MSKLQLNTREKILRAALLLFLEKGFKNVSYRDLVQQTDLSKGAIYHYFASKEALLVAVFDMFSEFSKQPVGSAPAAVQDEESFRKIYLDIRKGQLKDFKAYLGTEIANFNWIRFCLEAIEAHDGLRNTIRDLSNRDIRFFEACFLSLQQHGKLPKGKVPLLMAECLYYLLEGAGLIMFLVENKKDEDYIRMFDKTLENFFKII